MRFITACLFIFSLVFINALPAQQISPVLNEYNFENGLSSNQALSVTQDDDGFLWVGTADGLDRYDGNTFTHYFASNTNSIADNHVNAVVSMRNNILAIGTVNGLSFLNTHTGLFKTFRVKEATGLYNMRNNFVMMCIDSNYNLWAATQTDLYIFNAKQQLVKTIPGHFTAADINKKLVQWVWSLTPLPDGNIVVGFTNGEKKYNNLKEVTTANTLLPAAAETHDLIYMQPGKTWFIKSNIDSVFLYNVASAKYSAFPLFKGASKKVAWFTRMYAVNEHTLLLHFADTGFFRLTFSGTSSALQHINTLPPVNDISDFFKDKQGNLWVTTANGLYEWSLYKNQFTGIILSKGNETSSAETDYFLHVENSLWIASYGNGIYKYDYGNKHIQHYSLTIDNPALTSMVWNISLHSPDTLWLGTQQGLLWFNIRNNKYGRLRCIHSSSLDSFPLTTQFTDSKGLLWMGAGGGHGVVCYNTNTSMFTEYNSSTFPSFPLRHPTAITEDVNNNIWFGTQRGGGLVKWKRADNSFQLIAVNNKSPFKDDRIYSMYCSGNNHLYLGVGYSSLFEYDINANSFTNIAKSNWQLHGRILAFDGSHYPLLWMTAENGLHFYNTQTKQFQSFYKKDGLPADAYTSGVWYDSVTKKTYAGFANGFATFNADKIYSSNHLPTVIITEVNVNNQPQHVDINGQLHLTHTQNNLTVSFTAVDLIDGADLKFRYRLNNKEPWNNAASNRQINFSNLSPGHYTLLIEAANKNNVWNTKSTALQFYIQPAFWQTIWFYILIALVVAALVFWLYKFRIKQLQHVIKMRNHISRDLHDDIGGTMTAINLTNQLAIQNLHNPETAQRLLYNISDDLKTVGESLDDIVWTVNPNNDSMEEIMARMRRYASSTWEGAGIQFTLLFDEQISNVRLNMELRHDLYLVFKEAVNNVAKHAKCINAKASLSIQNNMLCMDVLDDGKGFYTGTASSRNGLKNMQSRVQKWKGECIIESDTGKGTSVTLRLPVTQKSD